MLTDQEYKARKREAQQRLRAGDLNGAIGIQSELVEQLMTGGPQFVRTHPAQAAQLERAAGDLVDSLRWDGQYAAAIALQDRLVEYLPELSGALQLGAANLRIEGGQADAGLAQLEALATADPDNFWFQVSLGLGCLYLERFEQAAQVLRQAAGLAHVRKVDRALAYKYLVGLYDHQGQTEEALAAWREASRLDQSLRAEMLPSVCRMLVYWHKFLEASNHINLETNPVRRMFYKGLLLHALGESKESTETWRSVVSEHLPAELKGGHDEYAEACLRLQAPGNAIAALNPLVEAGQAAYFRMVILGLAYAQARDVIRARWFFDSALRLGDMERPRRTMTAPQGRILDIHARLLYVEIPLHSDVRLAIDQYFSPLEGKTEVVLPTAQTDTGEAAENSGTAGAD